MAKIPFMPLYTSDYLGDTGHLSTEEHGAYLLLLMHMWNRGGTLPNDAKKLSRVARCSLKKWNSIWPALEDFFTSDDEVITCPNLGAVNPNYRPHVSEATRTAVAIMADGKCEYCGTSEGKFHIDHFIPFSRGGSDEIENLRYACVACNLSKGAKLPSEWEGVA